MIGTVPGIDALLGSVEESFGRAAASLPPWPDPHADRSPADDEYSRLTDPGRYRILGARADAWLAALAGSGLAAVGRTDVVAWAEEPPTVVSRLDRAVPAVSGGLTLVVARWGLGDVPDAGVSIGVGDPAVRIVWLPHCGCDACDEGSQSELERLDRYLVSVVTGAYRRLRRGDQVIEVLGPEGWTASGQRGAQAVAAILLDPRGWQELRGASWLDVGGPL